MPLLVFHPFSGFALFFSSLSALTDFSNTFLNILVSLCHSWTFLALFIGIPGFFNLNCVPVHPVFPVIPVQSVFPVFLLSCLSFFPVRPFFPVLSSLDEV